MLETLGVLARFGTLQHGILDAVPEFLRCVSVCWLEEAIVDGFAKSKRFAKELGCHFQKKTSGTWYHSHHNDH